jgi:hypothetical protein
MIVFITGHCSHVLNSGNLAVDIENIVLNVLTTPNITLSPSEGEQNVPGIKKRKFSAIASSKVTSQKSAL